MEATWPIKTTYKIPMSNNNKAVIKVLKVLKKNKQIYTVEPLLSSLLFSKHFTNPLLLFKILFSISD